MRWRAPLNTAKGTTASLVPSLFGAGAHSALGRGTRDDDVRRLADAALRALNGSNASLHLQGEELALQVVSPIRGTLIRPKGGVHDNGASKPRGTRELHDVGAAR